MLRSLATGALVAGLAMTPALAASRTIELPAFDQVSVSAGITAVIDVGMAQAVTADAPTDATLQRLDISVKGSQLVIGLKWNVVDQLIALGASKGVMIHITPPRLAPESTSTT